VDPLGLDKDGCRFVSTLASSFGRRRRETNAFLFSPAAQATRVGIGLTFGFGNITARTLGTVSPVRALVAVGTGQGVANLTIGATAASGTLTAVVTAISTTAAGSGVSRASVVGFATGGGFAGGPGYGPSSPSRSKSADAGLDCGNTVAFGGYGGAGVSFFATTATNPSQLAGPFKVYSFNLRWGLCVLSLQYAVGGDGTKVFSYGGPLPGGIPTGGGYGVSVSSYCTNTGVVSWP